VTIGNTGVGTECHLSVGTNRKWDSAEHSGSVASDYGNGEHWASVIRHAVVASMI